MLYSCCSETSVNLEGKIELPRENNALRTPKAADHRVLCSPPAWDPLQPPQVGLAPAMAAPRLTPSTATPSLSNQGGLSSLSHLFLEYLLETCLLGGEG